MKRILLTFVLGLAIGSAIWFGLNPFFKSAPKEGASTSSLASATILNPTKPIAAFSLTSTNDQIFTEASLLGHWSVLFFGYAECPEICPRTLATLNQVWNRLPPDIRNTDRLRFVFVSLDPKSDTVPNLRTFLNRFNTAFIGLTGDETIIKNLSKACSIYSWQDQKGNSQGPKVIDHSATLLLINPEGHIHALFSPPHEVGSISSDLQTLVK